MIGIDLSIHSENCVEAEDSTLLLDDYTGAQTAISINRKLRTDYSGSAFRVRRSSDNSEQDIGFSGNFVDETALTTFVGANDGFLVTVYDQDTGTNDFIQSTASKQYRIVNAGTVEKLNGKINAVAVDLTATMRCTVTGSATTTMFIVSKITGNFREMFSSPVSQYYIGQSRDSSATTLYKNMPAPGTTYVNNSALALNNRGDLYAATFDIQSITTFTGVDLSHANWTSINIGGFLSSYSPVDQWQEIIIYDSDKSSDRDAINTDINAYYGAY